jgi:hypothetical protein
MPNTALRFRPTAEIFTALGQSPPPAAGARGRGAGAGPDTRNAQPEQPVAQQQPAAEQRPSAQQRSTPQSGNAQNTTRQQRAAAERPSAEERAAQRPRNQTADGVSEPAADGGGGSGRRGGRANVQERLAAMSPEERERFIERMRARGATPPAEGQAAVATQSAEAPRRGRGAGPGTAAAQTTASPVNAQNGPTTFDALFGPLAPTESFGQVWLNVDGKLQRVRLRLGITDGQQTELIQALDGKLEEGTEVVTSVVLGAVRQTPNPQGGAAFPGLGGGRGGRFGGRGGG